MNPYDEHKKYTLETRKHFSTIIRDIFGDQPFTKLIDNKEEIYEILLLMEQKINLDRKKMSYIWWWRGGNSHIERFELIDDFLYINHWKIRIKEIYIQISPISIFDFIIFRVVGEENDSPMTQNYIWDNNFVDLDLNRHTFRDVYIKDYIDEDILQFKQPFNFILTAQFGLPNLNLSRYTDSRIEIMLNKLLFGITKHSDFATWYNLTLDSLRKKVDSFYNHLKKYPMLALEDDLGKHIYDNITALDKFEIKKGSFYRARQLKSNAPYDESNMWHPPAENVAVYEGRYNHFGQSFLYLAGAEETAFKEVIPSWHKSCSMIKINLQKPINVLDLRKVNFYSESKGMDYIILHYMLVYEGAISQETKNPYVKPEYLVPRFIADCARLNRFEGILFNSTKGKGENLVLFEPEVLKRNGKVVTDNQPYIYELK